MPDISISEAVLLWNSGFHDVTPAFVVRPLGHDDYYRYDGQVGACFSSWHQKDIVGQKLQLLIDAWHIAAFYKVPIDLIHEGLLVVPEYRAMLADDCLPNAFRHER